mgnify:CR=1 FL=1
MVTIPDYGRNHDSVGIVKGMGDTIPGESRRTDDLPTVVNTVSVALGPTHSAKVFYNSFVIQESMEGTIPSGS